MDTIGPPELLIIVLVLVVLFGSSRLPRTARSLGEGLREFRNGLREASQPTGPDRSNNPPPGGATQPGDPATPGP